MNYTFSGRIIAALVGRAYKFSNELGGSLGASHVGGFTWRRASK